MVEIYGTLGPACASAGTLEAMMREGMTGVRLNLSHVTLPEAAPMVEALREAGRRCGLTPKLLIDMQGPELRIAALPAPIELREGETVSLGFVPAPIREKIAAGQEILLDDGKLLLRAIDGQHAEVLRGGVNAVHRGQREAALSLGLSENRTFFKIIFPQAFAYVIPSLISELVIILKDTTFAYIVSFNDLMQNASVLISNYDALLSVYLVVAVIYILINYLLNRLSVALAGTRR